MTSKVRVMTTRVIAAIVAGSVVTGCSRPAHRARPRDTALAANVEAFLSVRCVRE